MDNDRRHPDADGIDLACLREICPGFTDSELRILRKAADDVLAVSEYGDTVFPKDALGQSLRLRRYIEDKVDLMRRAGDAGEIRSPFRYLLQAIRNDEAAAALAPCT